MNFSTLADRSYVPYSGEKQACVVKGASGKLYGGVRIENISYPLTISPVQGALFCCLASGDKPETVITPEKPDNEGLMPYWLSEYDCTLKTDPDFEFELHNPVITDIENEQELMKRLRNLCSAAVAPNSDFQVSALLETDTGWMPGVNVECSVWELGLCAERLAVSRFFTHGTGVPGRIFVAAPKSEYVSPCGACRQVLLEHMPDSRIMLDQNDNKMLSVKISHLLPYHFGGEILRK